MSNLLAGRFLFFMGVAATCSFFHHRRSVIPFAAKQKANTPTNIKTTNAIHIANQEVRQKTGNSRTIVNSAEMVAIKPMTAVKIIDFCNTW
jgi:hypothetical protein